MSRCCNETGCRRKQPFKLYRGFLSGNVYLGTRYVVTDNGDGTGHFSFAQRHDVSESMEIFIRENADYVKSVLGLETAQ